MSWRDRICPRMSNENTAVPSSPATPVDLQRIVFLLNAGDLDAAASAAKSLRDATLAREAWRLIASANANLQRFDFALSALDRALDFDKGALPLRLERALLLEADGRGDESCA